MNIKPTTSVRQAAYGTHVHLSKPPHCSPGQPNFPHPPPSRRDLFTNYRLNEQFVSIKSALLTMLATRQVVNLPLGFPFRCLPAVGGSINDSTARLSDSSYEFLEHVAIDSMTVPCPIIFSYTAPADCSSYVGPKNETSLSKMLWQIKIPAQNSMYPNEAFNNFHIVSQVEVDPELLETPFGYDLLTDKRIILDALSVSLEQGSHLTLQIASKCSGINKSKRRDNSSYQSGDIVYVANGREVVHVCDNPYRI